MLSHLFVGITDFERALAFYRPLMQALGWAERFCESQRPWAGWQHAQDQRPYFLMGRPFEGAHEPGNGQMCAFLCARRADVDHVHRLALQLGGHCEGAPGLRPQYHDHYYGAYFRDPDRNKLAVACHNPE